jgi:GntR family transcriptional regulator/MocR family aminotransferase
MISFHPLVALQREASSPLYLQIASALMGAIQAGHLKPAMRLPAVRRLAADLEVHPKTVVAAYEELAAQGWVEAFARKGVFVARHLPQVKPEALPHLHSSLSSRGKASFAWYDQIQSVPATNMQHWKPGFNEGFPDVRLAPTHLLAQEMGRLCRHMPSRKYLSYGEAAGSTRLREALAGHLADTRLLANDPDRILITRGSQMSFYLTGRLLLRPGDGVVVGEPGYFAAEQTFAQLGGVLYRVPVDAQGVDVEAVEQVCRQKPIRLVYVVPHHHQPTTVTMPAHRRMRLLSLARQYGFAILEDDYDFDYHYEANPILPLANVSTTGHVIYIGSVCKTIAPALRIGFMVGPVDFIEAATRLRRLIDRQGDSLLEEALAWLYTNGDMARHLKKTQKIYHQRRDLFCQLLQAHLGEAVTFQVPRGGMAVWTVFNQPLHLLTIAQEAARQGFTMSNGSLYNTETKNYNATRLGFASLNEAEMQQAVGKLATVIQKYKGISGQKP